MKQVIPIHGPDHGPGGPDPIPVTADLAWAYAAGDKAGTPTAGSYVPTWYALRTNTPGFVEGASITAGRATHIQLNEAGYYLVRAAVYLQTAGTFDTASDNELVVTYNEAGIDTRIQNGIGAADTSGMMWSDVAMQRVGEVGGIGLFESLTFNYDPDNPASDLDYAAPLQIGLSLDVSVDTANRTIGAEIWLLRVAATPGYGADLIA